MKIKYLLSIIVLFVISKGYCQTDSLKHVRDHKEMSKKNYHDKTEYIFNPNSTKINSIGLYFAPEMGATQLDKKLAPMAGGSFMLLLNKKIGIGFTGYVSGNPHNKSELMKLGYGGVKLEYTIKPNARFHTTIPLLIGAGFANNDSLDHFRNQNFGSGRPKHDFDNHGRQQFNQFFIIQPGINVEGNLMKYVKVFGGVNYRIATKMDSHPQNISITEIKPSQISGLSVNLGLKFGVFDYQIHKRDSLRKRNNDEHRKYR
jgi:hypothetical protein